MRFMIIVRGNAISESGAMPDEQLMAAMASFHEDLAKAGVLLDATGLQPTSKGWRIRYDTGGKRTILDGPFTESKELVAGYTIIQVRSREEALEWTRRFPAPFGPDMQSEIEVRQLYEAEDFQDMPGSQCLRALKADTQ
ncbi:conserved protein of unknown function [Pararobbsia alpina]|uniref:YciI family protein n=1 Tax=Pararobbsia alpina TaxID=621374 RepID=UPI0039A646D2